RVPTQIDRFILLKSLLCEKFSLKAEVHSSEIIERVKHFFFNLFSQKLFTSPTLLKPYRVCRVGGCAL
ncbi:hypothetical protein, partial [Vibrio parahaemolyticus]|uniref:hypothetical protein n=3 Tax=Vibrio parahaemolyticus TaxID=670 RepID=UPI003C79CC65